MKQAIHALPRQGGILRPALVVFVALSLVTGLSLPDQRHRRRCLSARSRRLADPRRRQGGGIGAPVFRMEPSATAPMPYNAAGSGGSNLGPRNPRWPRRSRPASPCSSRRSGESAACPGGSGQPRAAVWTTSVRRRRFTGRPRARAQPAEVDALIAANTESPGSACYPAVALDKLAPRLTTMRLGMVLPALFSLKPRAHGRYR